MYQIQNFNNAVQGGLTLGPELIPPNKDDNRKIKDTKKAINARLEQQFQNFTTTPRLKAEIKKQQDALEALQMPRDMSKAFMLGRLDEADRKFSEKLNGYRADLKKDFIKELNLKRPEIRAIYQQELQEKFGDGTWTIKKENFINEKIEALADQAANQVINNISIADRKENEKIKKLINENFNNIAANEYALAFRKDMGLKSPYTEKEETDLTLTSDKPDPKLAELENIRKEVHTGIFERRTFEITEKEGGGKMFSFFTGSDKCLRMAIDGAIAEGWHLNKDGTPGTMVVKFSGVQFASANPDVPSLSRTPELQRQAFKLIMFGINFEYGSGLFSGSVNGVAKPSKIYTVDEIVKAWQKDGTILDKKAFETCEKPTLNVKVPGLTLSTEAQQLQKQVASQKETWQEAKRQIGLLKEAKGELGSKPGEEPALASRARLKAPPSGQEGGSKFKP